jgi:hypothetical protein
MADLYECELLVSFAKTDDFRELFRVLLARAKEERQLRSELEKATLKERQRKDGKPFKFTAGQQKMLARFEQDAAEAREQMKTGLSKFPTDADLLRVFYGGEKQARDLDNRLWRDKKGKLKFQEEQRILDFLEVTLKLVEEFAAKRSLRLTFL